MTEKQKPATEIIKYVVEGREFNTLGEAEIYSRRKHLADLLIWAAGAERERPVPYDHYERPFSELAFDMAKKVLQKNDAVASAMIALLENAKGNNP